MWVDPHSVARLTVQVADGLAEPECTQELGRLLRSVAADAPANLRFLVDGRETSLRPSPVDTYRLAYAADLVWLTPVAVYSPDPVTFTDAVEAILSTAGDPEAAAAVVVGTRRDGACDFTAAVVALTAPGPSALRLGCRDATRSLTDWISHSPALMSGVGPNTRGVP